MPETSRKRKGEELLRIFNMAGEELLEITLKEPQTASAVKRQVQTRTGLPRFRQRLLGHNGPLGDADMVSAPADLQLVKLDYAPTNRQDTVQMIAAARSPTPARLEQLLSRPLDPNCARATFFSTTTPLEAATKGRRSENIKLLLGSSSQRQHRRRPRPAVASSTATGPNGRTAPDRSPV